MIEAVKYSKSKAESSETELFKLKAITELLLLDSANIIKIFMFSFSGSSLIEPAKRIHT
jgi:hypothetical protein